MTLASERLGIIAKMDLIEGEDGTVTPVDTKKGKRPHVAEGAYEPERVQVCAQALILEDAGYRVEEGAIWYGGSRERVRIALDEELRARTRAAISDLRLAAGSGRVLPPLVDSPKCTRCSLAGICLPNEVTFFRRGLAPRYIGEYPLFQLALSAVPEDERTGPLVTDTDGDPVRYRLFYGMYQDVREAAGVPNNVWSSQARHGGGTEAREAGAPIDEIADHLQKSEVEGTRRDYIVGNVETTRRVARKRVASRPKAVGSG